LPDRLEAIEDSLGALKQHETDLWEKLKTQLSNWTEDLEARLAKQIADGLSSIPAPAVSLTGMLG
jgi:hypothetical protein